MTNKHFGQSPPAIALHRSVFILQQKADELLAREAGVSLSWVRIMSQLHPHVACSQRTIATMLHQTEANVSRQLQAMKKSGMVSIQKSRNDKRLREVTLTVKGSKHYQKAERLLEKQYPHANEITGLAERLRLLA